MKNNDVEHYSNELDLKDLFLRLWHGKVYIILSSIISVFLAALYIQSLDKEYTVTYNLKPVAETENKSPLNGLNGIASLAGINISSNSSVDFMIFKELLTSVEVSEVIFENNEELIKNIYASEWNTALNKYSKPKKSKIRSLISDIKQLIIGKNADYIPPNPQRLSIFIGSSIQINENKETGFLEITSETSNPDLMLSLILQAANASDKIMRQRYVEFSADPLAFYKVKLRTARAQEHRESLAQLIAIEEQKLMLASKGKYFAAEPYMNPTISLYPTSPKPKLILALAILLGLFTSSAVLLILSAKTKDK